MGKPIIVVGMHRSGTSLLSLFLNELGVNMGDEKLASSHSNPTGHHEDLFFLNLHTEILNKCNGDWDSPPERAILNSEWITHSASIQNKIDENKEKKQWGWKDPRTSLFLDCYLRVIPDPIVIYCKRNSDEVENSIYARDKISKEHTKSLKKHYDSEIKKALQKHREAKTIEVNFKDIILEPGNTIDLLSELLDISIDEKNKDQIIKKIINRKEINKIKTKYKKIESICLIKKSIQNPLLAYKVISHRIKRRTWRKSWLANHG